MAYNDRDFGDTVDSALILRPLETQDSDEESRSSSYEYVFMVKCIYHFETPSKYYVLRDSGTLKVDFQQDIFHCIASNSALDNQAFELRTFEQQETAAALFALELNQLVDQGFRPYHNGSFIPDADVVPNFAFHQHSLMPDIVGIGLEAFQPLLNSIEFEHFRHLSLLRSELEIKPVDEYAPIFSYNKMPSYKTRSLIGRGIKLVEASIYWVYPSVGRPNHTFTDILRGLQWRLVTMFSGFEMMIFALLGIGDEDKSSFTKVFWGSKHRRNLLKMADALLPAINLKATHILEEKTVDNFLLINSGDLKKLKSYMCQSAGAAHMQTIDNMDKVVSLAKILRNLTTHCFISPTRVIRWELLETYIEVTRQLARFALIILEAIHRARAHQLSLDAYLMRETYAPITYKNKVQTKGVD